MVRVRLYRFDPGVDAEPRYESYEVPHTPNMRIMDVLDHIFEKEAVDFGYRWLCGSKKCGSCAVKVNGTPKLACWEEALPEMTIEPMDHMPVVRDLVTSRDPYEATLAKISPMLERKAEYPGFPEPLNAVQFQPAVHLRDCIQCLACQSVCPVLAQPDSGFAGPAPLVALADLALDPRDGADRARIAGEVAQVFKCVSCYECQRVCPVEIPIVSEAIEPLKRMATQAGVGPGARRAKAFLEVVKERGTANATAIALKSGSVGGGKLALAFRMVMRGKIDLAAGLFGGKSAGSEALKKTYESVEEMK